MKKYIVVMFMLVAITVVSGCSKKEVSFNTLEDARGTARENALWNAQKWRATMPIYQTWDIVGRGDSSQTPDCPQGDGWATMDFYSPDKNKVAKVKCSTVSSNIGCLEQSDFKTKPYAYEDGTCQSTTKVPFPLPKVGK